jgi:hypothetical protein
MTARPAAEVDAHGWLSDVEGRIAHVFLALPAYSEEAVPRFLGCIRAVLTALGPEVRYTVLHHPPYAEDLLRTAAAAGVGPLDLVPWTDGWVWRLDGERAHLEDGILRIAGVPWPDFTGWVQDGFLVATASGAEPRICASPTVSRRHGGLDGDVPRLLAEHLGWECERLPAELQAGNVLVDRRHVVVGADAVGPVPQPRRADLLERLGARTGQADGLLVTFPGTPQPVFHQDLYLTLAGDDPTTGQPLAVVGSVRQARRLLGEPMDKRDPDTALDAIARRFAELGYGVVRVPLLPRYFEEDDTEWVSYNNCLVEVYAQPGGGVFRRVILPSYGVEGGAGFAAMDATVGRVWRGLGFEVVFARGEFLWLSEYFGSLRCMTKVLARRSPGRAGHPRSSPMHSVPAE